MIESVESVATHQREFLVAALQRSGHHAVINWILAQCDSPKCLLNHVKPGANPLSTFRKDSTFEGVTPEQLAGPHIPLECLIFNYEDHALPSIFQPAFTDHREHWLGTPRYRRDLLILRDPYNFFASRLKWSYGNKYPGGTHSLVKPIARDKLVALWKSYARQFIAGLDDTTAMIPISYNRWFMDEDYRRQLAGTLQLSFTDAGLQEVARWGPNLWPGNSFDGLNYDGNAQKMEVMDRWRQFLDDELYLSLFRDPEVHELSRAIFGEQEGAEMIAHRASRFRTRFFSFITRLRHRHWKPA